MISKFLRVYAGIAAISLLLALTSISSADKTSLLLDSKLAPIVAEASGSLAKDTVIALGRFHRVQASSGFHDAAVYISEKAREYGLQDVHIETFPADGKTMYNTFRSYYGWDAEAGVLTETSPRQELIADYSRIPVSLADYSNDADVKAELIDVGKGDTDADYKGKDVKGKIVLCFANVADAHREAVEKRGAAGVLSYQSNQTTGWSGDYPDNIRWGHLSPYNLNNTFAFMISLRKARELQKRLAGNEKIQLHAFVKAHMRPGNFEVVTGIIPGTDPAAGEIVFSCHLCHEKAGANDNASGAATILEDARLLVTLIKQGKLPQPRRTIRFIWPPEITGTACYFARHPEEVRKMVAAIHMDMVGGNSKTKAIFHLTHTPASLPSFVNDVAEVFGRYVIDGSRSAAMNGDFSDAMISPDGSKELLVADSYHFTMGSDHDVYQEGSFRVPTIYLNDWPDVFIHTNNDLPENIDATKLQRVAVIGATSGYFLASAGRSEARQLAAIVFAKSEKQQGEAEEKGFSVAQSDFHSAENEIQQSSAQQLESLSSIHRLAPDDQQLNQLLNVMKKEIESRRNSALAILAALKRSPQTESKSDPLANIIPKRNPQVIGNLDVYFFNYFTEHLGVEKPAALVAISGLPEGETIAYETLNLVNGQRSIRQIIDVLNAAYGTVPDSVELDYFKLLQRVRVVTLENR
jgi:aminopeptidase YwaD